METDTDIYAGGETAPKRRTSAHALYIAFYGHEPLRPPSRHALDDVDVIELGRDDKSTRITRDRWNGMGRLVARVADKRMSSRHAQITRGFNGKWVLSDLDSKNGTFVRGAPTRSIELDDGEAFMLGNTVFVLAREEGAGVAIGGGALDVTAAELHEQAAVQELATFDPALALTYRALERIAPWTTSVLLLGETGTGKEVAACAIHELSQRPGKLVAVNCATLPATLVEAELFGSRRGAFTGATADQLGYIRTAHQGTLFLDEIGELPLPAQAALLRVLDEGAVIPVGDSLPVKVDVRVCAATNRDLHAMVEARQFREDLYARICTCTLQLPPLRRRRADLGLLIGTLLRRLRRGERVSFSSTAAMRLFEHTWPRNIRELRAALEMTTVMVDNGPISLEHLPEDVRVPRAPGPRPPSEPGAAGAPAPAPRPPAALGPKDLELRATVEGVLQQCGGNVTEAAKLLNKDRKQLYRWCRRLGIPLEEIRHDT